MSVTLRICLMYLAFGFLWILLSDYLLLGLAQTPAEFAIFQTYKGWMFVFASTAVIYLLLNRSDAERQRTEARLRAQNELLSEMSRVAKAGGWEFDPLTRQGTWTDETARIHDLQPGDPTNVSLGLSFYQGESRMRIEHAIREAIEQGQPYDLELEMISAAGKQKWVRTIGNPVKQGDRVVRVGGMFQDITDRKQAEEEIRSLNQDLERRVFERTAQLQAVNKELEAFSYSVSHDLRAPLRAISGFAAIIARRHRPNLNEEGRHYIDNIVQASERMGQLIDHLLHYSRIGRTVTRQESVSLPNLIADIVGDLQGRLDEIHATIHVTEELPRVKGDPTLLRQIFTNLLENAVTYRQTDKQLHINIECRTIDPHVIIALSDNGIGIPFEYQEKIFNIFQRLHSEDQYPGTGIGLATVKKAAELMGGAVWVESTVGEGSTFFVRLLKEELYEQNSPYPAR